MDRQLGVPGEAHSRAVRACAEAVSRLMSAGIAPEALAEYVPTRRAFLRRKPATMRPLGHVWRMGPLLLGTGGELYAAGHATRAAERGRPGYQSVSREERREVAAAALRGGYPAGTPVNYGAVLVLDEATAPPHDGSELPVGISDGEVRVRWRAGATLDGAPTLAAFLAERVELLVHPPHGATE
ncbi:MAG: hypothetical protein ACTHZ9_12780 [Leucobacter sp.]